MAKETAASGDTEAVRRLHDDWMAANAAIDADRMRTFLAEDCRYFDVNGGRYDGVEAILEMESSSRSIVSKHPDAPGEQLAIFDYDETPTVVVDGNVGWVTFLATLRGVLGDQEVAIPMRGTEIVRRREGRWSIVHAHFSPAASDQDSQ